MRKIARLCPTGHFIYPCCFHTRRTIGPRPWSNVWEGMPTAHEILPALTKIIRTMETHGCWHWLIGMIAELQHYSVSTSKSKIMLTASPTQHDPIFIELLIEWNPFKYYFSLFAQFIYLCVRNGSPFWIFSQFDKHVKLLANEIYYCRNQKSN